MKTIEKRRRYSPEEIERGRRLMREIVSDESIPLSVRQHLLHLIATKDKDALRRIAREFQATVDDPHPFLRPR